jgi:molecular chaperone Hsp33
MSSAPKDRVLRALTTDGGFRVIAASTTRTVQGAIAAQKAPFPAAETFADLLTSAILFRESMSPEFRVQVIMQASDQRSRLVADALPGGITRGLVTLPEGLRAMPVGPNGVLQVQRTMANGEVHTGVVSVPEDGDVSRAMMRYMHESEQIVTMVTVGCHIENGVVVSAGGLLLQLLPEVERQKLMVMTERMEDFRDIHPLLAQGKADPKTLIDETFWGMEYVQTSESELDFGCHCSPARLAASLSTLPKSEIEDMIAAGAPLEITCQFCGTEYKFHPEQLRGMLVSH